MAFYAVFEMQPFDPTLQTQTWCINASGTAGGWASGTADWGFPSVGTIWPRPTSPQPLDSSCGVILDINDSGDAVGYSTPSDFPTRHPCLLRGGLVVDLVPTLPVGSSPLGLNNNGIVVGWLGTGAGDRGFVYDSVAKTAPVVIPPLPGQYMSLARAVNSSGAVVGISDNRGILFAGGRLVDLGVMSPVTGINDSGIATGSTFGPSFSQAIICDTKLPSPSFTKIPLPPGGFVGSDGSAINNKGDVVGTAWTHKDNWGGDQTAFIYTGSVSTDLNTLIPAGTGWNLQYANDINDNGQIVGSGVLNGKKLGFLLNPTSPPDPCQPIRDELANMSSADFKSPADYERARKEVEAQLVACMRNYREAAALTRVPPEDVPHEARVSGPKRLLSRARDELLQQSLQADCFLNDVRSSLGLFRVLLVLGSLIEP